MRFWVPIFVTGLVLGAVETSIVATPGLWLVLLNRLNITYDLSAAITAFGLLPFAIDPIIMFIAMFFLGRKFDISLGYRRAFMALLIGTAVGTFGYLLASVVYAIEIGVFANVQSVFENVLVLDAFGTLRLTLVGFAGLAFSHFARWHIPALDQPSA